MESSASKNLKKALSVRFVPEDAVRLQILLTCFMGCERVSYQDIPMKKEAKDETIFLAYDERALCPCEGGKGSAWQSRPVACTPGESYFIPRITRRLIVDAVETGLFDSIGSMKKLWDEVFPGIAQDAAPLFLELIKHSSNTLIEGGLILVVARSISYPKDLHDTIDAAGLLGIISPHSRASTLQGLSWYQINPTLFWEKKVQH
jgi:hypothetical protein